jgi:hypothetical protein
MSGGLDFGEDFEAGQRDYNLATEGQHQPGSSFKPFALIAYLEQDGSLNSYWNISNPVVIECSIPGGPAGGLEWTVRVLIATVFTGYPQQNSTAAPEVKSQILTISNTNRREILLTIFGSKYVFLNIFEFIFGCSCTRWIDYEKKYNPMDKPLRQVLLHRLTRAGKTYEISVANVCLVRRRPTVSEQPGK